MYIKGLQLVERGEKMKSAKKSDLYKDIMAMKKRVQDRLADMDKNGRLDGKVGVLLIDAPETRLQRLM